jgi:hypothetical protein
VLVASMKKNLQSKSPNPIGLLDYFDIWAASRKSKKAVLDFFDSLSPPLTPWMELSRSMGRTTQRVMRLILILFSGSRHESS